MVINPRNKLRERHKLRERRHGPPQLAILAASEGAEVAMTVRRKVLIIIVGVAILLPRESAMSQNATGPPHCVDRTQRVGTLNAIYGESLVARGLSKAGLLMEIYVAPTGTWTIIATTPNGISCLVDNGVAWGTVTMSGMSDSRIIR